MTSPAKSCPRTASWMLLAVLALGCGGSGGSSQGSTTGDPDARIDASDDAALQASLEKINNALNDEGKRKFVADAAVLAIPIAPKNETLKKGFSKEALLQGQLQAFKALNGLNASEVAAKADAVRAANAAKTKTKSKATR